MVKLICRTHDHEMEKSFVRHPYAGRLIKDEKIVVANMTKSMVKPRNILLTLKEHNATSSKVIVTSPMSKWKLLIFLCQSSTKAHISHQSPVSEEHVIKGLSPLEPQCLQSLEQVYRT